MVDLEDLVPLTLRTMRGPAEYIGRYRSVRENQHYYVYRWKEQQGTCQYYEIPERDMVEMLEGTGKLPSRD